MERSLVSKESLLESMHLQRKWEGHHGLIGLAFPNPASSMKFSLYLHPPSQPYKVASPAQNTYRVTFDPVKYF